ncbi:MAG: hypothetical protein Q8O13_08175 [Candidatus Omnitrophota bacterium]|nr:hypothetical protein [Candidatus Omnitrophota bacterium]
MKKLLIVLMCLAIIGTVAIYFVQMKSQNIQRQRWRIVEFKEFPRSIKCSNYDFGTLAISDKPVLRYKGIKVYESASHGPVLVFKNQEVFCRGFVKDCGHSDFAFVYGKREDSGKKVLLFKETTCSGDKFKDSQEIWYIDVSTKEGLYRVSDEGKPLVVSRQNPVPLEERPGYYGEQFFSGGTQDTQELTVYRNIVQPGIMRCQEDKDCLALESLATSCNLDEECRATLISVCFDRGCGPPCGRVYKSVAALNKNYAQTYVEFIHKREGEKCKTIMCLACAPGPGYSPPKEPDISKITAGCEQKKCVLKPAG